MGRSLDIGDRAILPRSSYLAQTMPHASGPIRTCLTQELTRQLEIVQWVIMEHFAQHAYQHTTRTETNALSAQIRNMTSSKVFSCSCVVQPS